MNDQHIERVRRICLALPETWEKISHGEPTWFVGKKVFAMFSNNHHNDGHVAVTLPGGDWHSGDVDQEVAEEILPAAIRRSARLDRY